VGPPRRSSEQRRDGAPLGHVLSGLAGAGSLDEVLAVIATQPATRDQVLLVLLERAQSGEQLAGRAVLQAMLGRAVRVSATVAQRLDVRGDQEEALACAVAALWQVIATYPVRSRRARVAANLAMDTVAVAQRGHTGSSHLRRRPLEVPVADLGTLRVAAHRDRELDELHGPADAELLTLLAWAVRTHVLDAAEAQLLLRVYTPDATGRRTSARTVAEQQGLAWPTLRQRCARLTRRLREAATAADLVGGEPASGWLLAVA
jgi:hypothetical protein